ncbi:MAG: tyrosine-protein phosphatase [Verrucomicrobia bacterium]|nr:tyrosine-protein phosphatase [Verrucomicrobiota bacterium]
METIELIEPANQSVSHPLQQHSIPVDEGDASRPGGEDNGGASTVYLWDNLQVVSVDRSIPRPVTLSWKKLPRRWLAAAYEVTLSTAPDLQEKPRVITGLSKPTADVWHLHIGTTYYWTVVAHRKGERIASSPTWTFTTNSLPPRWIRVPGITNVRDIGGWPLPGNRRIRQGLVYRSSEMNGSLQLTRRGRDVLEKELGIRTDLDFRSEYEGAEGALDPNQVQWIHIPISPYDCIGDAAFRDGYRRIFETFADDANYPIVFHCVGGADRGGTVAFLLNALLGKRLDHLIHDYELTTLSVWGERSRMSEQFQGLVNALKAFGPDDDVTKQAENYMAHIGLPPDAVAAIRRILIEA